MRKEITNPEENANEEEVSLKYDGKAHVFKGAVLGFFIGLAIIVPGVSGAAVAIIFGLYEKLLYAMGNLLRKFKKCFVFLLPVIIGGVIGIAGGFFGVRKLMNVIPFAVVALFAGLMTGALPVITDKIKDKDPNKIYSDNIMTSLLQNYLRGIKKNDLVSLKKYLDNNEELKQYVSSIKYNYNANINIYKSDYSEYATQLVPYKIPVLSSEFPLSD